MKLCDAHAHVGHWPFRHLPFHDVPSLLREMDRLGVERAAVCNTHSVFYKNPHAGNEELKEQTRRHPDRLVPVATLDPTYVRAADDLKACCEDLGFAALRLVPTYHGYDLTSEPALSFASAAAEAHMAIVVPRLLVDVRQRHAMDTGRTLEVEQLLDFARRLPKAAILGVEFPVGVDGGLIRRLGGVPNLSFGISRIAALSRRVLPTLIDRVGASRFLFASGVPFKGSHAGMVKIATLPKAADRNALGHRNFERIFGA